VSLGKDCNECVCFVLGDPKHNSNMFLMVLQTGYEGKRRVFFLGMTKSQQSPSKRVTAVIFCWQNANKSLVVPVPMVV